MPTLGLDLGRNLGWVLGDAVGPLRHGTFMMEDTTDLGAFLRSSDTFCREMFPQASALAIEKPDTQGLSYFGVRKNMAMLGHCSYWWSYYGNGTAINEVSVTTGKLTLAGHGRADKDRMMAAAAERGYPGLNEHEADALGIWWVHVFGRAEPIRKARSKSGKGIVITEAPLNAPGVTGWKVSAKQGDLL